MLSGIRNENDKSWTEKWTFFFFFFTCFTTTSSSSSSCSSSFHTTTKKNLTTVSWWWWWKKCNFYQPRARENGREKLRALGARSRGCDTRSRIHTFSPPLFSNRDPRLATYNEALWVLWCSRPTLARGWEPTRSSCCSGGSRANGEPNQSVSGLSPPLRVQGTATVMWKLMNAPNYHSFGKRARNYKFYSQKLTSS